MDGTFAVIFVLAGIGDMIMNDCDDACLGRVQVPAQIAGQASGVFFQDDDVAHEVFLSYDQNLKFGPFQPTLGISLTNDQGLWLGYGAKWQAHWGSTFLEASLLPGLYAPGDGPDLGGALHFRSGLAIGYRFDNGATLALALDHRSNGGMEDRNPGLETVGLRYSVALN